MIRRAVLAVVFASLAIAPARARADAPADEFTAAISALSKGRFAEAANKFVALADANPEHRLADDALFAAGKLFEERLGKPQRAVAIYRRLLAKYPDSREALGAKRRLDELVKGLGAGGKGAAALAAYTDVLQRFHLRDQSDSIRRMEALVRTFPKWSGLPKAMLWLGARHEGANRLAQADKWYRAAAELAEQRTTAPDRDEHLFEAYRGAGTIAARRGQFDRARGYFERMPVGDDASKRHARDRLLADLGARKRRTTWYVIAIGVLVLLLGAGIASLRLNSESWAASARALLRPPTEIVFMIPIAGVLMLASFTGHHPTAKAVTIITFGSLVITWLNGVAISTPKSSQLRTWLHLAGSGIAALALIYIALHLTDLIDQMKTALRLGPDPS